MAIIPNRSDIVKKLEKDVQAAIERAVNSIADALNKTTSLPLEWSIKDMDLQVSRAVKDRLGSAGWKVEVNSDEMYFLIS